MNKEQKIKRMNVGRKTVMFWCLFIGIGAILGSMLMLINPDGSLLHMDKMLPYFQVLPFADILFQDFVFAGISLLVVNGITNMVAYFLLLKKKKSGILLGLAFGITLMLWIIIQFIIFPFNFMSTIYFIFGFAQMVTGIVTYIFYLQTKFDFSIEAAPKTLNLANCAVIYFSRMGYTEKIAYEQSVSSQSDLIQLETKERTEGTMGFWWCGRFGMHKWEMELKNLIDLSHYEKIIIVTPIWVFKMCGPVRFFMKKNQDVLKHIPVEIVFNHFNKGLPEKAIIEAKQYANITKVTSICTHYGKSRVINQE